MTSIKIVRHHLKWQFCDGRSEAAIGVLKFIGRSFGLEHVPWSVSFWFDFLGAHGHCGRLGMLTIVVIEEIGTVRLLK